LSEWSEKYFYVTHRADDKGVREEAKIGTLWHQIAGASVIAVNGKLVKVK
jgi:coproporphyrinogen III oxidase